MFHTSKNTISWAVQQSPKWCTLQRLMKHCDVALWQDSYMCKANVHSSILQVEYEDSCTCNNMCVIRCGPVTFTAATQAWKVELLFGVIVKGLHARRLYHTIEVQHHWSGYLYTWTRYYSLSLSSVPSHAFDIEEEHQLAWSLTREWGAC